ncbi:MAG: ABC-ATPase domain-containing protein [Deltaproteobacteria bacterium]
MSEFRGGGRGRGGAGGGAARGRPQRREAGPPPSEDLGESLRALDGRSYGEYKCLARRAWPLGAFQLTLEHVQGDPFAAPSRVLLEVPALVPGLAAWAYSTRDQRRATADFLHRALLRVLADEGPRSGHGGGVRITIAALGQEILERSAVVVLPDGACRIRLSVGLPAAGRRILGRAAAELLLRRMPEALQAAVAAGAFAESELRRQVEVVEDQVALRAALEARGLVAFLADDALLPRASGVDDRPLAGGLPLHAPAPLAVELDAPNAGRLRGLGIRRGVTLVVGGGYHGKSTLLEALARSVYDHIPGDGREFCVTNEATVCVRAEDGRAVHGVDLRPFIHDLPLGRDAADFSSEDASGSTSQAAAIVEALEAGARVLLIDEDTAATNFMIRDARMRRLVPAGSEPITPFIDRVRQLAEEQGIASVLVVGGAGDYLDVADTVVRMEIYAPADVSEEAAAVRAALPLGTDARPQAPGPWPQPAPRIPVPDSFDPGRGPRGERVRARSVRGIEFGREEIDLSLVAQLVDAAQCRWIGDQLLDLSRGRCDGAASIEELLDGIEARLREGGIEAVIEPGWGDRAVARRFEVATAINRLRTLRCRSTASPRLPST